MPSTPPSPGPGAPPERIAAADPPRLLTAVADSAERLLKAVCVVLFTVMIVVVFFEVVMRYVFNAPTFWSEALARSTMVWLVLLGMAIGIRYQAHIRVDFIVLALPDGAQAPLAAIRYAVAIAFAAVMLFYGIELAVPNLDQSLPGIEIPVFYVYLAAPVSAAFMLLFLVELIWKRDVRPF